MVQAFAGHLQAISGCCFLPQTLQFTEPMFATTSMDSTIRIWSCNRQTALAVVHLPDRPCSIDACSGPGGTINLAAGTDGGDVVILALRQQPDATDDLAVTLTALSRL